jgi:hypothetical protein
VSNVYAKYSKLITEAHPSAAALCCSNPDMAASIISLRSSASEAQVHQPYCTMFVCMTKRSPDVTVSIGTALLSLRS